MVELSPLRQLRLGQLPKMVSWYDPRLLARIGVRTIISSVFGQYADQRLIQAVTDPCDDKDLCTRYDYSDPNAADPNRRIAADETGAFWLDYVADVGDGFESTYTIAYLLAQDNLDVRQAGRLRHGEVLIMGGDQCYPQATREEYKKKLLTPYNWAFTVKNPDRKLFAHPGQPRLVRRPHLLRQPVLLVARPELQGQRDRRLAVPAAPQLLGRASCPTTGGSGAPTSSSRNTSTPARSATSRPWPRRWGRRTISSSAWRSPPGCWRISPARTRRRISSRSPRSRASAACASAPSLPATGTTTRAISPTSSTSTSSRRAAAAPSCIRPTS